MAFLDKKKPFGEVFGGESRIKYRYEQNNKYFNAQGEEVTKDGIPINVPEPQQAPQQQAATAQAKPQGNPLHKPQKR